MRSRAAQAQGPSAGCRQLRTCSGLSGGAIGAQCRRTGTPAAGPGARLGPTAGVGAASSPSKLMPKMPPQRGAVYGTRCRDSASQWRAGSRRNWRTGCSCYCLLPQVVSPSPSFQPCHLCSLRSGASTGCLHGCSYRLRPGRPGP